MLAVHASNHDETPREAVWFAKHPKESYSELRQLPVEILVDHFGQAGNHLWQLAQGLDNRSVVPDHEAKSISNETTFAADSATWKS